MGSSVARPPSHRRKALLFLRNARRTLLDGGTELAHAGDLALVRRIRTVNGCCLILLACTPTTLALYVSFEAWRASLGLIATAIVISGVLLGVRRGLRVEVATHLLVANLLALLCFLGFELGGVRAPGKTWIFVPAFLAGLVLGARAAGVYAALGAATLIGFYVLDVLGVGLPSALPADMITLYEVSVSVLLGGALLAVVSAFLDAQHEAEQALLAANHDLERSRDAAEAATEAKSAFLATMSHEIRTPLNGIFGMTELALDTTDQDERHDFLLRARACAESLMTILNDVLDFSKVEADKLVLESIAFDVRAVLEGVLDTLAIEAGRKQLELVGAVDDALPARLSGDPNRLRQIIMNLASNALKFTEQGEILIRLERAELVGADGAPEGERVGLHCAIHDTGIGVSADEQQRIFDSFTQADSSMTRRYGGTGLGLAISQRLVALMGGTIAVDSELGRGSIFHFTVPFRAEPSPPTAPPAPELAALRVLVVDDNATARAVVGDMLRSWGCRIALARGGAEGLALLLEARRRGEGFDVVLLDVEMPDLDGVAVATRIRGEPTIHEVSIVALTPIGRPTAEGQRFDELVPKPIKPTQLAEALVASLRRRATGAERARGSRHS